MQSDKNRGSSLNYSIILDSPHRDKVNAELRNIINQLFPNHSLFSDICYHLNFDMPEDHKTIAYGKRLRSILCLLIAEHIGADLKRVLPVACALELFHNASLIIDDIQDNEDQRCGRETLWCKSGITRAINTSFLLKTAGELILLEKAKDDKYYHIALQELLATVTHMADGQTRDIEAKKHWKGDMTSYYEIIQLKTGSLVGTTCVLGVLDFCTSHQIGLFRNFGSNLGIIHQVQDDIDDLIRLQAGKSPRLNPGNVANFLVTELSLCKPTAALTDSIKEVVRHLPFWLRLHKEIIRLQDLLKNSLEAIRDINVEVYNKLGAVASVISCRNNSAVAEIIHQTKN